MIRSVCGYCGVRCGLKYDESQLIDDIAYPTNQGKVCSKGISELISIQTPTRLLRPTMRASLKNEYKISTWQECMEYIAQTIKHTPKDKIGFYLSGQIIMV